MKQVIAHRGASGSELENSAAAIKKALSLKLDVIEIDVRLTQDKKLILCHDADLQVMAGDDRKVSDLTWAELKQIRLRDGSRLLSLRDFMKMVGRQGLVIEAKESGSEDELIDVLDDFPKSRVTIASFKRGVLSAVRKQRPDLALYVLEHTNPSDAVHFASRQKLQGIGLNFWILNPITYHQARRAKLDVYVYTVNNRFFGKFLSFLYPSVTICTDHPERFI